jgi:hypothetical protein
MSGSLWQSKPWWCQPWTILLTGIVVCAGAWLGSGLLLPGLQLWISAAVALGVAAWWLLFLVLVPRAWAAATAAEADQGRAGQAR